MSLRNPANNLRVPGRLVINPTDLTAAFPFGGSELGLTRDVVLMPQQQVYLIRAEEYGGVPVEAVQAGEAWTALALLESWDADALGKVFGGTSTDTTTQRPYVTAPSGIGTKVSTRVCKLLFVPEDRDHHPAWIMYAALPLVEESARIRLSAQVAQGIPLIFHGTLDSSSRCFHWGMLHGITL